MRGRGPRRARQGRRRRRRPVLSGTRIEHRELEARLADWLGTQGAVLHPSCMAANQGLFGALAARLANADEP